MSTESSEEISTVCDGVAMCFFFVLLGFFLILSFLNAFVFAHNLNAICNEHNTKVRIIKANQLVVARIVQFTNGHWEGNNRHYNWIPPAMQLSYDYENENYLAWKNNIDKHTFSQRSTHCNVYIDPSNPNKFILQDSSSDCASYVYSICFFLISIAGSGGIYYFILLSANSICENISIKVGLVLFGCFNFMPAIALTCIKCCKSLFQHNYYSNLGVEESVGIEFKNIPNQNSIESTTITETETL